MTSTLINNAASDKQINFIKTLIDEREMTLNEREARSLTTHLLTKKTASELIDMLLKLPKRTDKVRFKSTATGTLQEALAKAPKSKYAIPVEEIDIIVEDTPMHGDLLFIEIREYMGRLFMRRLTGAPGGFSRWHVNPEDAATIAEHLAKDPYRYAKIFGERYSCCGSCGAELTDPVSRELQLGPECRKKFGK
jgi:hypothetical protein